MGIFWDLSETMESDACQRRESGTESFSLGRIRGGEIKKTLRCATKVYYPFLRLCTIPRSALLLNHTFPPQRLLK
jgi:hypothetical protein